jgi:hypothetical protein
MGCTDLLENRVWYAQKADARWSPQFKDLFNKRLPNGKYYMIVDVPLFVMSNDVYSSLVSILEKSLADLLGPSEFGLKWSEYQDIPTLVCSA